MKCFKNLKIKYNKLIEKRRNKKELKRIKDLTFLFCFFALVCLFVVIIGSNDKN